MVVDALLDTFGPFLIPAVLFVVGIVGYAIMIALTRYGILSGRGQDPPRED